VVSFPSDYHSRTRTELERFLPRGLDQVLELGCAEGKTGEWLKQIGVARRVVGVEGFAAAADAARGRLDEVHCADLNTFSLPGDERFDLILAADVIEHLVEPAQVLNRLLVHLRPGGTLITSTPNVRYWRVLFDLAVRGDWTYGSNVILDPTHLRFFTQSSIVRLHEGLGLRVREVGHLELSGKRKLLDRVTLGQARDFLCGQHVVVSIRH
jgi:2-polyprenyl-3-methyl-5-hydroxy-6-metoxy-1,4-benzoquinol methylase